MGSKVSIPTLELVRGKIDSLLAGAEVIYNATPYKSGYIMALQNLRTEVQDLINWKLVRLPKDSK